MDISLFTENAIEYLGNYAYLIVILFGLMHGIIDNPWSFLTMGLSLTLLPLPIAYPVLLLSNYVGSMIQYFGLKSINERSGNYFYEKRVSKKILTWLEKQPVWKHIIVVGMPLVPTVPLRIAFPFSTISFKKYMTIIIGAYIFLYSMYSLVYFGLLSFLSDSISRPLGITLLFLFCILIYFGRSIKDKFLYINKGEDM